jgi:fermentation-respiration switch protein FrsA (DUF1100 family)
VRELRRGVDVIASLGADPDRLAVIGFSWGGVIAAQLAGVEHRIGSFVLMSSDGGAVEHWTGPDDASGPLASLTADARDAYLAAMEPIEPLYFIAQAAPSALLFQAGEHDDVIQRVDAERLHAAASEPKDIRWYDSGHDPTPDAPEVWCEQAQWLQERLSLASAAVPECDRA